MFGKNRRDPSKKRRVELHETTAENDIRYRGPFTAQHFRILGWLCLAVMQVVVIMKLGSKIDDGYAANTAGWQEVLENIANLSLPFLLIANFAQLIDNEQGYKRQLIRNGAATLAVCGLFYLMFYRYIVGGVATFLEDPTKALPTVTGALSLVAPYGFIAVNLFVDLFLCTLTMLFLNYHPRRVFTGRWRICFRLFALLPVAYEVGCMLLKVYSAKGLLRIPVWAYPLLTVKPPMTFVLFVALAVFVKMRELRFLRHGKTHEEYQAFLKTRRNSLNFSVFLAVMLVIVGIIDGAVSISFSFGEMVHRLESDMVNTMSEQMPDGRSVEDYLSELPPEEAEDAVMTLFGQTITSDKFDTMMISGMRMAQAVGFGDSIYLILLAPLVLLFSYSRRSKYPWLDLCIPVAGMLLIFFVYLEGIHQLLAVLNLGKINLQEAGDMGALYMGMMQ